MSTEVWGAARGAGGRFRVPGALCSLGAARGALVRAPESPKVSGFPGADEEVTCASMGGVTDAGVAGRSTGDRGGSRG